MDTDHFNPETYAVVDRITGEEVPVQIFIERASAEYWEKAYAKTLAEYINVSGNGSSKVLAYLIRNKNVDNLVLNTVRGISDELSLSTAVVTNTFKALRGKGLMKTIRGGCYLMSPQLLRHGSKNRGAMLLRIWEDVG